MADFFDASSWGSTSFEGSGSSSLGSIDPAYSGGSTSNPLSTGSSSAWWQDTLGFVIKAAAVDRYTPKAVQQTSQYQLDQYGNLVPMGAGIQVTGQTSVSNDYMMYAALAVGALLLFSFLKD